MNNMAEVFGHNNMAEFIGPPKETLETKFFAPGSRRSWMDEVVDPGDAIQDLEVDADIFYDYFLSIPQIKTVRRFKDRKQDWYDKLAVIAAAMPDGLKWVEIEKPSDDKWSEIQNQNLSKVLEQFYNPKTKEAELSKKIWDSFQVGNLIDLSGDRTYIKTQSGRYFKPTVMDGEKQSKDLKDAVKDRGGQDAVKMMVTCAAHYKRFTEADRAVTVLETQKKYQLYCSTFDKEVPRYIPKRPVHPQKNFKASKDSTVDEKESTNTQFWQDPFEKTHEIFKKFAKPRERYSDSVYVEPPPELMWSPKTKKVEIIHPPEKRYETPSQFNDCKAWKLTEKELDELEQAWTVDRLEELKVKGKKEKVEGCCSCSSICARMACCFSFCGCREDRQTKLLRTIHEAAIKQQTRISKIHKGKAENPFKESIFAKFSVLGFLDASFFKWSYAMLVNLVVIFLILAIMNTIGSGGLPGRQRLDDKTSFKVILKVNGDLESQDRFDKPEEIFDVCQGLGWWMQDDSLFTSEPYDWPITDTAVLTRDPLGTYRGTTSGRAANPLSKLATKHWDPLLNQNDRCPRLLAGLAGKLKVNWYNEPWGPTQPWDEQGRNCYGAQPDSSTWNGDDETQEYFLFQDQGVQDQNGGFEVLKRKGLVLTNKNGVSKEFTLMSGSFNGKVQQLQPIDPLDPISSGGLSSLSKDTTRWDYEPFWKALDRIWPSEWAVQALFSLNVNSNVNGNSQYDEKQIVGGYNSFGRRPTAIVQANLGGDIGGVNSHGYMIEEAIWQFLERRCWHKKFSYRQPMSHTSTPMAVMKPHNPLSQYDKDYVFNVDEKTGKKSQIDWKDLDQGLRDYWRGLGLGVNTTQCKGGQLLSDLVTTNDPCISGKTKCTRVNYHSVKRWNAYNNDTIAAMNFNARDFTSIFFSYDCEGKADGSPPTATPRTWDKIELAEDVGGKLLAAASNLGYDGDEWKKHSQEPKRKSGPPDNLVLDLENYLEGESYFGSYFWTQVCCIVIMICVSMPEIRNLVLWAELLPPARGPETQWYNPESWCTWLKWLFASCQDFSKNTKDVVRTVVIRWGSMLIAIGSYVVIPVLLVMVSVLLILESGSVLDVIKDTLSLLFLNDINNFLQVRNAPDGSKWTIKITAQKLHLLMRKKNMFSYILVTFFVIVAIVTTRVVYTGSAADSGLKGGIRVHPSILFNLGRFRSTWDGFISWAVFVILLFMVGVVWKLTEKICDLLTYWEGQEKYEWQQSVTDWFRNIFDDKKAMDDEDWDTAVPFEELAEDIEEEERQVLLYQMQAQQPKGFRPTDSPPPPPQSAPDPPQSAIVSGIWKSQNQNGQMMEVLIHEDNGEVMATRFPGDISGTVRWFLEPTAMDTTASTASLVRPSGIPNSPMFRSPQVHEA